MAELLKLRREKEELLLLVSELTLKLSQAQKTEVMKDFPLSSRALPRHLHIARSTLFYKKKRPENRGWLQNSLRLTLQLLVPTGICSIVCSL